TSGSRCYLFEGDARQEVEFIGPYLLPRNTTVVEPRATPISDVPPMNYGSMPNDGGHLILSADDARALGEDCLASQFIKPFWGAGEIVGGVPRYCIWVESGAVPLARKSSVLSARFDAVKRLREATTRKATKVLADVPWRFGEVRQTDADQLLVVP